jgi:hypothetical protein
MKNGELCKARWLSKDHAFEAKLKAQHHSRSFSRQQQSYKTDGATGFDNRHNPCWV